MGVNGCGLYVLDQGSPREMNCDSTPHSYKNIILQKIYTYLFFFGPYNNFNQFLLEICSFWNIMQSTISDIISEYPWVHHSYFQRLNEWKNNCSEHLGHPCVGQVSCHFWTLVSLVTHFVKRFMKRRVQTPLNKAMLDCNTW